MITVLVTDSQTRTALYVIRALGKKGFHVTAHIQKRHLNLSAFGFKSRYVRRRVVTQSSSESGEEFVRELASCAQGNDVIVPIHTDTIKAVAENRHLFQGIGCLVPDPEQLGLAEDKSKLHDHLKANGIPVPTTFVPGSKKELLELAERITYPVYIKLRQEGSFSPKERYSVASEPRQLIPCYEEMHRRLPFPIVQEKINGTVLGFFALFDQECRPVALFCHRRIRQYPTAGGPSSCCESHADPEIISSGIKLLAHLKWKGLAMVEFIKDDRDDVPKVLEINPRFWGSLPLAIEAGVDFPNLFVHASLGWKIDRVPDYRVGLKLRFLVNDLMATAAGMKDGKGKIGPIHDFLRDAFDFRIKEGVVSLSDFRPSLAYLGLLLERSV